MATNSAQLCFVQEHLQRLRSNMRKLRRSAWQQCGHVRLSRYLMKLSTFKLLTHHKPLVPMINQRDLDKTPLLCQRLLMRLMRFNPLTEHVPGRLMVVAVTLSRSPLYDGRVFPKRSRQRYSHASSVNNTNLCKGKNL